MSEKEIKKVNRRGLGNARGTTRLKFSHEQAKPNGLFIAHLDDVKVDKITIGEDKTGMPSFNGFEIPRLVLTFASNEEDVSKRHYITLRFTPVESNVKTIPGGSEEWKVNSIFDWLKHILNVYVLKGRELTDEEESALSLDYTDFDDSGEYVPVEPETVISAWTNLFENFENIINRGKDGAPYYNDKNGKPILTWIKLIRYIKNNKKGWQPINDGELAFPTFVGEGCIEIFKQGVPASIRINTIKEAIIPMKIEKPKAPNMPMMGNDVPIIDTMNSNGNMNDIAIAAGEDMPF